MVDLDAPPARRPRGPSRPRLTTPLIRRGGELEPASWDEALAAAAAGLGRVIERDGPDGFGMFSCSKSTNEMNYMAQKFARTVVGTNNIDSCNRT
jgi:formate dehydrogenase major subunit